MQLSQLNVSLQSNTLQMEQMNTSLNGVRRVVLNIARETTANQCRYTASTGGSSAAKRDTDFKRFLLREYGLGATECMVLSARMPLICNAAADAIEAGEQSPPPPRPPASVVIGECMLEGRALALTLDLVCLHNIGMPMCVHIVL